MTTKEISIILATDYINDTNMQYSTEDRTENILQDVEKAINEVGITASIEDIAEKTKEIRFDRFYNIVSECYEKRGFGPRTAEEFARKSAEYIAVCVGDGSTDDDVAEGAESGADDDYSNRVQEIEGIIYQCYLNAGFNGAGAHDRTYNEGCGNSIYEGILNDETNEEWWEEATKFANEEYDDQCEEVRDIMYQCYIDAGFTKDEANDRIEAQDDIVHDTASEWDLTDFANEFAKHAETEFANSNR